MPTFTSVSVIIVWGIFLTFFKSSILLYILIAEIFSLCQIDRLNRSQSLFFSVKRISATELIFNNRYRKWSRSQSLSQECVRHKSCTLTHSHQIIINTNSLNVIEVSFNRLQMNMGLYLKFFIYPKFLLSTFWIYL